MRPAVFLAVLLSSAAAAAAPKARVGAVVDRSARWVERLERDFITTIADERYEQVVTAGEDEEVSRRTIDSELLFMRDSAQRWSAVRNVLAYADAGEPTVEVPNSRDRLTRALAEGDGRSALRRLADESARYNIGGIARNFNTPTLALQFLDEAHRWRFKFHLEQQVTIGGDEAWRLSYREHEHPTLIRANYRDTELSGEIWSRVADGAVLRTSLVLQDPADRHHDGLVTTITVDYANDPKLQMTVPARMHEEYVQIGGHTERIRGDATYTNYRVFETSGRVIIPQ